MNNAIDNFLCCARCKGCLSRNGKFLTCWKCGEKYLIKNKLIERISSLSMDLELTAKKWDELYKKQLMNRKYLFEYKNYCDNYLSDTYSQLNNEKEIGKTIVYLEIGCGPFFLGNEIAKKAKFVLGIDICSAALKIANSLLKKNKIKNYLLIQGNILNMPIKAEKIDLIYGGGVIEHFKDTQKCANELYRVLKKDGVAFNTVPYLNVSAITYRQIWGNIPNLIILRQIAEFIHIKLLKGRHMIFGYELSFLAYTLHKIFKVAGFRHVKIDKFTVKLVFDFIPFKSFKKILAHLACNSRLFWPIIKVIAYK